MKFYKEKILKENGSHMSTYKKNRLTGGAEDCKKHLSQRKFTRFIFLSKKNAIKYSEYQ